MRQMLYKIEPGILHDLLRDLIDFGVINRTGQFVAYGTGDELNEHVYAHIEVLAVLLLFGKAAGIAE